MNNNDEDYPWWKYFIMPFMSGIVGYGTNALALYMTFHPTEFVGIEIWRMKDQPFGLFGYQGIIPSKAAKIAAKTVDNITSKLLNVKETFDKLEPEKFAESMAEGSLLMIDEIVQEVALKYMPAAWNRLPDDVKDEIVVVANSESHTFYSNMLKDMQDNIYDVYDLKNMAVNACVEQKHLLNTIFQEVGAKEFVFIRNSGFVFGFLFGCVQALIFFFYDGKWILPTFGFVVGWLTNYIALWLIFRPLEPMKICNLTLHGIFLKRQMDVAETYARVVCVEIVHVKAMWDSILTGPTKSNFNAILRAHSIVFTESLVKGMKPIAVAAIGAENFSMLKEDTAQMIMDKLPNIVDQSYHYITNALAVEETIVEKMKGLTYSEFEDVLHPAFEEDEVLLILVGGILGLMVGLAQLAIFK